MNLYPHVALQDSSKDQQQLSSLAGSLWEELCKQSWKTELDHGLGDSQSLQTEEALLLVTKSSQGVQQLAAAAAGAAGGGGDGGAWGEVVVVEFEGWNQGEVGEAKQLESWHQLQPKVKQVAVPAA
jgi:hypothetical protein